MPQALAHFALGTALTLFALAVVAPDGRYPYLWPVLGGIWALLPDVHWIAPVYGDALHRFHRTSPLVDLFWFHRTLDRLYPNEPSLTRRVSAVALGLLLVAAVVAEWRSHRVADERSGRAGSGPLPRRMGALAGAVRGWAGAGRQVHAPGRGGSVRAMTDDPIPPDEWAAIVRNVPLVSVDLLVVRDGGLVLGKRTNEPAAGEWFVPGGAVHKGESLTDAVHRVARMELGTDVRIERRLGTYEHFYETSDVPGVDDKQYLATAFVVTPLADDLSPDDQHAALETFADPARDLDLHPYVARYVADLDEVEDPDERASIDGLDDRRDERRDDGLDDGGDDGIDDRRDGG